ncbi:hypothetical protein SDC9_135331 [bioreactor metagenome]|uniref:Uncharacterized protein n=1 Tax=bioreactor metagenome TaxID=1076179 RepID=A0A645DFH1_9ZZZZ
MLGHGDVLDAFLPAERDESGMDQRVPGFGAAAADVVKPVRFGMAEKKPEHRRGILDVEKIAHLLAVGIFLAVGPEQLHHAGGGDLFICPQHHAAHFALMVLVGAVDVGKFAADQPIEPSPAFGVKVEHLLGIAVHIQRPQFFDRLLVVAVAERAVAVGGAAGGVNHPDPAADGELRQPDGKLKIVARQIAGIALGGRGAGPHVNDALNPRPVEDAGVKPRQKVVLLQVIGVAQRAQIFPLVGLAEMVHDQNVGLAPAIPLPHCRTADQPRSAGYDKHSKTSSI